MFFSCFHFVSVVADLELLRRLVKHQRQEGYQVATRPDRACNTSEFEAKQDGMTNGQESGVSREEGASHVVVK